MEDFQSMKHLQLERLPADGNFDLLSHIFMLQRNLSKNYKWTDGKTPEEITQVFAQAIASESQELINNCNWKPWKETKKQFNKEETIYEYIDIMHFVIDGLLALGIDSKTCTQYYIAKNKENQDRIKRSY